LDVYHTSTHGVALVVFFGFARALGIRGPCGSEPPVHWTSCRKSEVGTVGYVSRTANTRWRRAAAAAAVRRRRWKRHKSPGVITTHLGWVVSR